MEKSIITLNVDFDKVALEDVKSLCEMISKALPNEVVAVLPQGVYLAKMTIDEVLAVFDEDGATVKVGTPFVK